LFGPSATPRARAREEITRAARFAPGQVHQWNQPVQSGFRPGSPRTLAWQISGS